MLCHRLVLVTAIIVGVAHGQQFLFSLAVDPVNSSYGVQVAAGGDYDGDGTKDFVVLELGNELSGNYRQQFIRICSGVDGHQVRQYSHPSPNSNWIRCIASVDDMDGDLCPDVAVGTGLGLEVRSGATLQVVWGIGNSACLEALNPGDLNGDGRGDVLACFSIGSVYTHFAFSGIGGATLWSRADSYRGARVGDVNGDSRSELFVLSSLGAALLSGVNGQQLWSRSYPQGVNRRTAGLGDTNLDGVKDVAVSHPSVCSGGSCQGTVEILSGMNGVSLQVVTKPDPYSAFGWELCAAGDLTGDGRMGFLAGGGGAPSTLFGVSGTGSDVFALTDSYGGGLIGGFDLTSDGLNEFAYFSWASSTAGTVKVFSLMRATYSAFGSGCPGSLGTPSLTAVNLPRVGSHFDLQIANLRPFQLGFVYTGFSDQVWTASASQPLPFAMAPMGLPGCTLFIDPVIDGVTHSGAGTAAWGFTVPQNPAFYGFRFFNQAVFFDPFTSAGVVLSNAGRGTMGT